MDLTEEKGLKTKILEKNQRRVIQNQHMIEKVRNFFCSKEHIRRKTKNKHQKAEPFLGFPVDSSAKPGPLMSLSEHLQKKAIQR